MTEAIDYTVDNIVNGMASLQLDFGNVVTELATKLVPLNKLDESKKAIALKREHLEQSKQGSEEGKGISTSQGKVKADLREREIGGQQLDLAELYNRYKILRLKLLRVSLIATFLKPQRRSR